MSVLNLEQAVLHRGIIPRHEKSMAEGEAPGMIWRPGRRVRIGFSLTLGILAGIALLSVHPSTSNPCKPGFRHRHGRSYLRVRPFWKSSRDRDHPPSINHIGQALARPRALPRAPSSLCPLLPDKEVGRQKTPAIL